MFEPLNESLNTTFNTRSSCSNCGRNGALDPMRADADGMVTCECGHRAFAGYVAEAVAIEARLTWLKERISASDPAPDKDIALRYHIWPAPNATSPAPDRESSAMTTQTLLLSLGAALLIIAATVFAAVNWERLGAAAQVGLLAGLTAGLAVAAIRLRARLAATAEALAVVAFGLGVIDIVGAPGFGLVSERWLDRDHPYLPFAFAVLALLVLLAARRWRLQSWIWLGCLTVATTAGLTTRLAAHAFDGTRSGWALALGITSVIGVVLVGLAGPSSEAYRRPLDFAGFAALAIAGPAIGIQALTHQGLPGAIAAISATAAAAGLAGKFVTDRRESFTIGAGLATAPLPSLLLSLPNDPQPIVLGVLAGVFGGAALFACSRYRTVAAGVTAAAVVWGVWAAGRLIVMGEQGDNAVIVALVRQQLAWLGAIIALSLFVAAWINRGTHARHLAWPAAAAGELSWALTNVRWAPRMLETWTLPFAALLFLAGMLANRTQPANSSLRYGPAMGMALIPSACASWAAPWVAGNDGEPTEHVVRLIIVLAAGAGGLIVGGWRKQAGWFAPSTVAVSVAAASQMWTSIAALPRWVALGIAGSALVVAGARLERLQRGGQRTREWLRRLT